MNEETLEQRISHLEQQFEQMAEAFHANSQLMVMLARELKRIRNDMGYDDPMVRQ
jgi:hypothetical protein